MNEGQFKNKFPIPTTLEEIDLPAARRLIVFIEHLTQSFCIYACKSSFVYYVLKTNAVAHPSSDLKVRSVVNFLYLKINFRIEIYRRLIGELMAEILWLLNKFENGADIIKEVVKRFVICCIPADHHESLIMRIDEKLRFDCHQPAKSCSWVPKSLLIYHKKNRHKKFELS